MKLLDKHYRNLVKEFTLSWFKLVDQRTLMGAFWGFLNPLIMTSILYFLFKGTRDFNYFLYILIGIISWNFFCGAIQANHNVLLARADMLKNVIFPKEILIFSQSGVFICQHILEILAVSVFLIFGKVGFSIHLIFLPLIILIEFLLILGASLILSCVCVYARDMVYIWSIYARMGFFLVPIFYEISSLGSNFKLIVVLNPMTHIIGFYRDILLYHKTPNLFMLLGLIVLSCMFIVAGYKFFKLFEAKVAEKV